MAKPTLPFVPVFIRNIQVLQAVSSYEPNWKHPGDKSSRNKFLTWYLYCRDTVFSDGDLKNLGTNCLNEKLAEWTALPPEDSKHMEFVCCGCRLKSTDHLISALFRNKMTTKVKGWDFKVAIAEVMKGAYYPFTEGVSEETKGSVVN